MTHLLTRGEQQSRKHHQPWIPLLPPDVSNLDRLDFARHTPAYRAQEFEDMNVPKMEKFEKAPSVWVPLVVGVSASAGGFVAFLIAWIVGAL